MADQAFRSCEAVEGELFWNSDQNAYCCCFDYGDYPSVRVSPLEAGPFPLARYLAWRRETRARNRRGELSENCRTCCRLQERRWPADDSCQIRVLTVTHFKPCNVACTFCGNEELRLDRSIREVDVRPMLRDMVTRGLFHPDAQVHIAGGEPSIWPGLDDVLAILTPHRVRLVIYTNAVRYMSALDGLWGEEGRVELVCGIPAARRETHRAVAGVGHGFDTAWRNFARYARAGGESVRAELVLVPENAAEAEEFVERCVAAGGRAVEVDVDRRLTSPGDDLLHAAARFYRRACDHGLRLTWGDRLRIVRGLEPGRWQRYFGAGCRLPGDLRAGRHTLRIENAGKNPLAEDSIVYLSQADTQSSGLVSVEGGRAGGQAVETIDEAITALGRTLCLSSPDSFVELAAEEVVRLTFISNRWAGRARILVDGVEAGGIDTWRGGLYSRVLEVEVDVASRKLVAGPGPRR